MAYDEALDARIKKAVARWKGTEAKKMFGGVCHLMDGNMFCGVWKDFLILRIGQEQATAALKEKNVRVFDVTGRPMKGWVMVAPKAIGDDAALKDWLALARRFARTLPAK